MRIAFLPVPPLNPFSSHKPLHRPTPFHCCETRPPSEPDPNDQFIQPYNFPTEPQSRSTPPPIPPELQSPTFLHAPNGLPSGPSDLLDELLPLLAQEEQKEKAPVSEEEKVMRERIRAAATLFESMHRENAQMKNLRPFKLRNERQNCEVCKGDGMVVCEYCKGECFVDLTGKETDGLMDLGGGNFALMPKKVMDGFWHCPLCGGLGKERCIECLGSGKKEGKREKGEARKDMEMADGGFDIDSEMDVLANLVGGGEYEVGKDGMIVISRKKRGRKGAKKRKRVAPPVAKDGGGGGGEEEEEEEEHRQEKRETAMDLSREPAAGKDIPSRKKVGKSTDFVNTTDFKVGRKLQDEV